MWQFRGKLKIAYHYAFDTPTGFFCQMVSTPVLPEPLSGWVRSTLTSVSFGAGARAIRYSVNKALRADVCKYRPEVGKIKFLKNLKKIM